MRVLGLSGYAGAGKDTIADYLVEEHGWVKAAFADPLRQALYALDPYVQQAGASLSTVIDRLGWDRAKWAFPEVRTLQQRMGTEVGRQIFGEHFWTTLMLGRIGRLGDANPDVSVVIPDVRFRNEALAIDGIGVVWNVMRPGVGPVNSHSSERALDGFQCQTTIYNAGSIEHLRTAVDMALKEAHWATGTMRYV